MRKQTTTQKLNTAITNNLLQITKAECHYKSSNRIDEISADKFKNNFDFLCESGVFADCVGWHYEKNYKTGQYIAETGRMDGSVEKIIVVYLGVCEDVNVEDVDKALSVSEEE